MACLASGVIASAMAQVKTPTEAQTQAPPAGQSEDSTKPANSTLDGETFYQLFLGELEFLRGDAAIAYQALLDAAKRTRDETLFRRTVEMAASARAGEQALAAAKAWRTATPRSRSAAEVQLQLLMALGRPAEAIEPMRAAVELAPPAERNMVILGLSRVVVAGPNAGASAATLDKALEPWQLTPAQRPSVQLASARAWAVAGDTSRALGLIREAQVSEPGNESAALLALDLMGKQDGAQACIDTYLTAQPKGDRVRLAYARRLTSDQRYSDALRQAEAVTQSQPTLATAWMMQGALLIELGRPKDAQAALTRYVDLKQAAAAAAPAPDQAADAREGADDDNAGSNTPELSQVYLMLAQAAEQQKDFVGAQAWLDKLGEAQGNPNVVAQRASLLARQGKLAQARALIGTLPETTPAELRTKVMSETQLLRDMQAWPEAREVLVRANQRLPDDSELLYEQALIDERLKRFDEMEALLRRVMELKPDQQHAYNALGYSFVDRNLRLDEARQLIAKALTLAPGDPFITDSLGWAEYRLGRQDEALRLLRQAYDKRPDTEIAAHLGEVLWALGRQDEAREIWRAGRARDESNDVLQETLVRLKVRL
jgi:tetratricopeptide (TPR) repeat protein